MTNEQYERMRACPFCGKKRSLFVVPFSGDWDNPISWYVECAISDYGCGATGPAYETQDGAINAWNGEYNE